MKILQKAKNTLDYHYFRMKNDWTFPSSMAHTSGARMAKGTYEPEVTIIVKQHLREGALFIDVGANVGYFARVASRQVKDSGKVFAFEADFANYTALNSNTLQSENIIPLNFAVSNENGFKEVFQSSHSSCHSLVNTDNYLDGQKFICPSITLDLFWAHYLDEAFIDLIKIDVEGAEPLVWEGMEKIIRCNKINTIILEYCPYFFISSKLNMEEIIQCLLKKFSVSIIENEFKHLLETEQIQTVDQFEKISQHLLQMGGAVNINLLCQNRFL